MITPKIRIHHGLLKLRDQQSCHGCNTPFPNGFVLMTTGSKKFKKYWCPICVYMIRWLRILKPSDLLPGVLCTWDLDMFKKFSAEMPTYISDKNLWPRQSLGMTPTHMWRSS